MMSMILGLIFATDKEISKLLNRPEDIEQFLDDERTSTDLDKAWHGLHWLFTGTAEGGSEPLCYLIAGGKTIGDIDVGYGPARALSSKDVAAWDDALKPITSDQMKQRYDPKAMLKAQIYPDMWARSLTGEEEVVDYLLEYFAILKDFVAAAKRENSGLVIYLS